MATTPVINRFTISAQLLDNSGGNGAIDISNYLKRVAIKKNFIENVFPIFTLDFICTEDVRNTIRDNNCDIGLSIFMYNMDEDISNNNTDADAIFPTEKLIETVLRIYEKPFDTDDTDSDEDYDNDVMGESASNAAPFIKCSVSGVPKKNSDDNGSIVNTVFSNANSIEMVAKILTDNFNISNIYTDITEENINKDRFKTAIIPPQTPISAIKYIDTTYGIYKEGMLSLFLDTECCYIFNHYNTKKQYNRSFVYEHVDGTALTTVNTVPILDTSEQRIIFRNTSSPKYYNAELLMLNDIGSNTSYYSYSYDYSKNIRSNNHDSVIKKSRVFWNSSRAISNESSFDISNRKSEALPVYLRNINPEFFKPDTNFHINSKYDNISGEYTILENNCVFTSKDSKDFDSFVALSLIKIK